MYVNIKPADKNQVYTTPEQAIQHLWLYGVYHSKWNDGRPFGRAMADIRRVNDAIKAKDYSAFKASPRRGYWRIELA